MNHDNTIYPIYCEFFGKKNALMDTISKVKANNLDLLDNEKVYALIEIVKLYALAKYVPVVTYLKNKLIILKNMETKEEISFDFDDIKTQKDYSVAVLTALSYQEKYSSHKDPNRAVMEDLRNYYIATKNFDDLLNDVLKKENINKNIAEKSLKAVKHFLKEYTEEMLNDNVDNNITNIVFSEVKEDLEEYIN